MPRRRHFGWFPPSSLVLFACLCFCGLDPSRPAYAQSADTLAGMRAYNAGRLQEAFDLLRRATTAGDAEAMVNLGYFYARGQIVRADQAEAFRLYAASAARGNSEGMNALGYKYQFASGIPRDIPLAVYWYCKAISYGNARAMNNLALMLDAGEFLQKDVPQARDLWGQAATLGHRNAMYNLGLSHLGAAGSNEDRAIGWQWMVRAAEAGHRAAHEILRKNGYTGTLPAPYEDDSTRMVPTQRRVAGRATVCGVPIS